MPRLFARVAIPVVAVAALVALATPPAGAVVVPRPVGGPPRAAPPNQVTLGGDLFGPGHSVSGFIADPDNSFDPVTEGYPASNPTSGFSERDEGFAGVVIGTATDGSNAKLDLYCFDIRTNTGAGVNYILGTWNASNVPNVNYVAQVLNNFFPATDEPASLTSASDKAAAVQAAIWFFSDSYVLNTSDPLHDAVAQIVDAVIAKGPAPPPDPPTVNITPETLSGPTGSVVGPFTVHTSTPATVNSTGANMFTDAAGTQQLPEGATANDGQQIWLRSTGPPNAAVLQATGVATVPQNNVYLSVSGTNQRLILAQKATLTTTVNAKALFTETGSLIVRKTVTGPAAGKQDPVTINVRCGANGGVLVGDPFVIPAGSTGTSSMTYGNIPVGTACTVTEIHDGHTTTVNVEVTGSGQSVTIGTEPQTVDINDEYTFVDSGSLIVKKSITGDGAGLQGEVVIQPTCGGQHLDPFVIDAKTPAGETSKTYDGIAPNAVCTVTETGNGANSQVSVVVSGGEQVTVPPQETAETEVVDTYTQRPGSLVVTKSITGPGAGQQGPITITTTCVHDGTSTVLQPAFTIDAGTTTPPVQSQRYDDIPAGSVCTPVEYPDGSNATVAAAIRGSGQEVTIEPGAETTAELTDTYQAGELVVNKTIDGDAAGSQGRVVVHTECGGAPLSPDLVVPAGAKAGTYSQAYPDVIAGATCTVTETSDGSSSTVTVTTTIEGSPATISANGSGTVDVTDTYTFVPGSLEVTKTISGPSAADHGPVAIHVDCGAAVLVTDINIAAGAPSPPTQMFDNLPAGTKCTVTETQDGGTATIAATVTGSPAHVTIPPSGTATAHITDSYALAPGGIEVRKTINGGLAGKQGAITISVKCGATTLTPWTIAAETGATTLTHEFPNIPAGSSCIVTETSDGATAAVLASVTGANQTVTVPAAAVVPLSITDTYTPAAGVLTVTKHLAGAAAGLQGRVGILVVCGGTLQAFALVIPADHSAGPVKQVFSGVGGGSKCLVAEKIDGHTADISVVATHAHQVVTVPAGGSASAQMTDAFTKKVVLAATGPREPIAPLVGAALIAMLTGAALTLLGRRRRG